MILRLFLLDHKLTKFETGKRLWLCRPEIAED
jgi:hypothetical protein